uniref:Rab-GAP TBC domain-containing protein n=1 Tax=Caenorhabditis japonica TaxID=281687 RepID=A0A8R1DH82_CAEJA
MEPPENYSDVTRFENVDYLGCSQLLNNDDDTEMKLLMKVLDEQKGTQTVNVTLEVPHKITGTVRLLDSRGSILSSFALVNIRFCIRGDNTTSQNNCFGISLTHKSTNKSKDISTDILHQCHVFRTSKTETAIKALYCFSYAFANKSSDIDENRMKFQFESVLEIKENDGTLSKPNWKLCPQHKGVFKVRRDREKKLVVQLKQVGGFLLNIKKCFGMLLAAGRNLRHSDFQLLEMERNETNCDEPLLSGSGLVLQEYGEEKLKIWEELIEHWESTEKRPDEIDHLILDGIPDKLRGKVWQLLANVSESLELVEQYNVLITQPCPSEQIIMRDIHRTFPAHDHFKHAGGDGQQSLYNISKVYSLYDEEVSYCQGLSFLAASLLLHMKEEQAFCTLVRIMFSYGLRDLFKLGFDNLHLRFHQLTCLLKDYIPELSEHFDSIGIETHMYASQWFLTLFTAKFPLQMVFFILDIFLSQGMNTIFHISLALLHEAKTDLIQLDFEGSLKYFRVSLPRKYRTENATKRLIHRAVNFKLNHKKLDIYEKEYKQLKDLEKQNGDPVLRLEKEIVRHHANTLRLERENDDLAHELVTSKIELRKKLDEAEDQIETSANSIERLTRQNQDILEDNKNLMREYDQIKEMYRRDVLRLEENGLRSEKLLAEYKKLFSDRSKRAENEREQFEIQKKNIIARISDCDKCWSAVIEWEQSRIPANISSATGGVDILAKLDEREDHIKSLEIDLAQTKLLLVEAECRNQDLTHQLMAQTENDGKTWFKKTITQLKEVGNSLKNNERSNSSVSP